MKLLLLYPPFADPTQPYIALPVLKGYLAAKGFDVTTVDLNIAAVRYLFCKEHLLELKQRVKEKFRQINSKAQLDIFEQLTYKQLCESGRYIETLLQSGDEPALFFKDKNMFYNYEHYFRAAKDLDGIFQALSSLTFPYQFGFNYAGHFVLPWSNALLADYIRAEQSPLKTFYPAYLSRLGVSAADIAGVSLTFISQLPECFYLCSLIKKLNPGCFVIVGGACISQVLYAAPAPAVQRLFAYTDGICTGEGEETLAALLSLPCGFKNQPAMLAAIPNLVTREPGTGQVHAGPVKGFDICNSAAPDYSNYDLDAYLAPGRLLLYAPTRSCYWRKCSFCTYGFSYARDSHYQEIPAERAARELAALARGHATGHFYFSCDVLSPQYAEKLARELIRQGSTLLWSTDLRIEKQYTPELCRLLYAAGLRSVAFGIESGADPVLELIGKGITTGTMQEINRNFHTAGIATQWMTFTYHPGERVQDALKTLKLLNREQAVIDLFVAGEFQLVPGSRVMAEPGKYGIGQIFYLKGDEFRLFPLFTLQHPGQSGDSGREEIDARIDRLAARYALNHYPWAGAISTHHTFLYFLQYGQRVFAEYAEQKKQLQAAYFKRAGTDQADCAFSLKQIGENAGAFYNRIRRAMLQANSGQAGEQHLAPLCEETLAFAGGRIRPVMNKRKEVK